MITQKKYDARKLSPEAQEALRRRVVAAVRDGMPKTEAAQVFNVSRTAIYNWLKQVKRGGDRALKARKQGRPKGSRLEPWQAAVTVRTITDRCPDQLKMPFALWTREAVQNLLEDKFGVSVSIWTVGRYLAKWGLTPQKPLRKAYEQDPKEVQYWLDTEYKSIKRQATREGAEIHWGDEMGMRSDHQTGTSYGRRGKTPVIRGTGKRFRCNVISSITNYGTLRFMVFKKRLTSDVFLEFLRRLIRSSDRKVFLIVDRHPVHRSAKVEHWVDRHSDKIAMFYLPKYSPELNPDEMLNNDVKSNALGRQRPATQDEMVDTTRRYLRATQKQPDIVQSYFKAPSVRYAAE